MLKKILFPIIAIFLAYRSYELLKTLWFVEPSELVLPIRILLAFLLNLFITGFFAFLGFAYKTNRILGENYYRIKNPNFISRLSKLLKIEYFKKFLLLVFWGKEKNRQRYFDGTKLGLENFEYQTRQSEFGHLAALIVIQMVVFIMLLKQHYAIAFFTTILNLISNFYPVILQRNHRMQISRIRNILNRKPSV
ncbi:hypothetical protein [Aquiflexum sp.]|uniref:glycosyl-4,4'-diaponeurosporenoate acyltransferase CrtO family protein n=1 Tax=Aquiflexum sp. TaxID=1872584 RepID=UPI00359467EF